MLNKSNFLEMDGNDNDNIKILLSFTYGENPKSKWNHHVYKWMQSSH